MTDEECEARRLNYERHIAQMDHGSPLRHASERVLQGGASAADLCDVALWELREADYALPPAAPAARPEDGFHASCCIVRAMTMIREIRKRVRL